MKFSVIVPVYGVEKYLDACVQSVLDQTFGDFELILVDDCSPDGCPAMCDAWAQKDPRIRVIHKEVNEGLGFARNTGMASAMGAHILFLDSDDTVVPELLEVCAEAVADADILTFGVAFCHENREGMVTSKRVQIPQRSYGATPKEKAEIFAMLNREKIFQYAWNKIYSREFLLSCGTKFEKTKLIEDFLFNIEVFTHARRISAVDRQFYNYRKPVHETLASRYSPEFFELCKRKFMLEQQFLRHCDSDAETHRNLIVEGYINHLISAIIRNHSKSAALTVKQQCDCIRTMITDPVTVQVLSDYTPAGMKYKLICALMRAGCIRTLLMLSIGVEFMQQQVLPLVRKFSNR